MSWQTFMYAALLVFGIRESPNLTIWGLFTQLIAVFTILLLLSLSVGHALLMGLIIAYFGAVFVQLGYLVGILAQTLR